MQRDFISNSKPIKDLSVHKLRQNCALHRTLRFYFVVLPKEGGIQANIFKI